MNIKVHKDPNKLQEIVDLIYTVIHEQDYKDEMNNIYQKLFVDKKQFDRKYYSKIKKYLNRFKKQCSIDKTWGDMYFRKTPRESKDIASALITNWDIDRFRKIKENANNFSTEFYRNKLLYTVRQNYEDLQTKDEAFYKAAIKENNMENFVQFVSQVDISPETKWNYIEIFNNPQKYFCELANIIFMNEEAYNDAYGEIEEYINRLMADFEKNAEENIDSVQKNIGLVIDREKLIDLYPQIARNRELSYMEYDEKDINILYLGILVPVFVNLKKSDLEDEKYLFALAKNLGDKSKFEILTLLKNKEMYGQQIAEALNLTTATISYHMNDLVVCNFVKVYRIDTKIYYSLNKEEIKKFISSLDQYFK